MQQFVLLHVVYGKFTSQVSFSPRCLVAETNRQEKANNLETENFCFSSFSILSARLCLHYQFTLSSQQNRNQQQHIHWNTRQVIQGENKMTGATHAYFFLDVSVCVCV